METYKEKKGMMDFDSQMVITLFIFLLIMVLIIGGVVIWRTDPKYDILED